MGEIITGDDLFLGVRAQTVSAGKVDKPDSFPAKLEIGLFLLDCDARPVADMEPGPRYGVDERRFTGIRIAGNCNGNNLLSVIWLFTADC